MDYVFDDESLSEEEGFVVRGEGRKSVVVGKDELVIDSLGVLFVVVNVFVKCGIMYLFLI